MKVLVAQLHLTLCDPMNWSPPGYSLHRLVQARILEWVAIPFSRVWATREAPRILECVASPNPGIEPRSPALRADSSPSEPRGKASCVLHLPRSSSQFSSVIQSGPTLSLSLPGGLGLSLLLDKNQVFLLHSRRWGNLLWGSDTHFFSFVPRVFLGLGEFSIKKKINILLFHLSAILKKYYILDYLTSSWIQCLHCLISLWL